MATANENTMPMLANVRSIPEARPSVAGRTGPRRSASRPA
jgi:hypothetical protein